MTYKVKHTTKSRLVQTTLMLVLLGIAVYVFMQSSFFECKQVVVEGNKLLDERTILKAADVPMGSNLFYIDDSLVKTRLGLLPLVDEAMIYKELPGTFRIKLVERVPTIILSFFEKFILLGSLFFCLQMKKAASQPQRSGHQVPWLFQLPSEPPLCQFLHPFRQ